MTFNKIVLDQSSEIEIDDFIKTVDDDVLENTSLEEEEVKEEAEVIEEDDGDIMVSEALVSPRAEPEFDILVSLPVNSKLISGGRARPMSSVAPRLSSGSNCSGNGAARRSANQASGSCMIEDAIGMGSSI
jgi:hypothetical protein